MVKLFCKCFYLCFLLLQFHANAEIIPEIQKIMTRGKLVVAMVNQNFPPFFYHNKSSEFVGFDVELAKKIAKELGVQLEFNTTAKSFNDVVNIVEHDNADIALGSLSSSLDRGMHVSFTEPYLKDKKVLIINRVADLNLQSRDKPTLPGDLKFGVIKNSADESFLREKFYTINKYAAPSGVVSFDTLEQAMKQLMDGKIYAVFTDEIIANNLLKNIKSANIFTKIEVIPGQLDPICIVVNSKNQLLLNWMNLFVKNIEYSGEKTVLVEKYLKGF